MNSFMKTIVSFLFAAIVFHSTARADDPCLRGKDAIAKGDFKAAIEYLKEGVKKEPKSAECNLNLGIAYLNADSADQAVSQFVRARELDTLNFKIYELMGDAYNMQHIETAAIEQYLIAAAHDSANAGLYRKLAYDHLRLRDYGHAIGEFRKVIQLDTTDMDAYRQVGHLYFRAKDYEKSLPYLKVVYDHDPKDSLRLEFARGLYLAGRYPEYITVAESITIDDTTQAELKRWLLFSYAKTHQIEKIRKMFRLDDTVGFRPKDWMERAKLCKTLELDTASVFSFEKAMQGDSSLTKEIAYDLGSEYMRLKQYDKAVSNFETKIRLDTASGFAFASHLNAGMCLMQLKDWDGARKHVQSSIEVRPENVTAWRTLAQCYAQMDSTDESRDAYQKMVELIESGKDEDKEKFKDALLEGYRTEGFYLLVGKKYPAAIEEFKKVLAVDPANCQTLLWTAQAYILQNLRDDAKRYYCKVLINKCDAKFVADAKKGLEALGLGPADCGK